MSKYTVIETPAIQYLCGLIRDLASVSEGIDDLNLRSDGTFSSVKIDTLLNTLKTDCNEYTEKLVANLSRLELKLVTSESEITESNILYLFKPDGATSYNQYVVIEGNKVLLGTCDIDMAQYLKIADASKTYATKTELKAVTDKIGTTTLTTTAQTLTGSIEEVKGIAEQGALLTVTKTQYDELVAGGTVNIDGKDYTYDSNTYYVVKDDSDSITVTNSISSSSTDSEIATAKAVNDLLQTESPGNLTIPLNEDLNNLIYNRTRVWMNSQTVQIDTFTNMPSGHFTECAVIFIPYENATSDYGEQIFVGNNNRIFIRNKVKTTWTAWRRVCTTSSVADVAPTTITFTSTTNYKPSTNIPLRYTTINGICYVSGGIYCVSPSSSDTLVYTFPKPKAEWQYCKTIGVIKNIDDTNTVLITIGKNGELNLTKGVAGGEYRCTFSYPISQN